mmetsp:Transcript_41964/g.139126  ORF Transcript_41964/g.139126 Transcript_41964/m.139126 type:complete len:230 (-) Transcript_41964:26-715(-)
MITPNPGKGRERLLFAHRTPTRCRLSLTLINATTPRVLRTTVGGGSDSRGGFEGGDELEYPLHVRLERLERVRGELEHDLLRVRLARLIEDHLHDLGLHILGQLLLRVVSALQPRVEHAVVGAKHNDEVKPPLGEEVRAVEVDDDAAGLHALLQLVEDPVLVEHVALVLGVPARVQLLLPHERADLDVPHRRRALHDVLRGGALARPGRADDEDVGQLTRGGRGGHIVG